MSIILVGIVIFLLLQLYGYTYEMLWDRGLSFNVKFSAREAFEGENLYLEEELTNKKFLPLPWVHIEMIVPSTLIMLDDNEVSVPVKAAGNRIYSVMMYSVIRKKQQFICSKRGSYFLASSKLTVKNILNQDRYIKNFKINRELLVFPKILNDFHNIDALLKNLDGIVATNRLINPDPFEFKGIRDYVSTDALKSLNFKASAVSQKLMVNVHAPTSTKRMTIVLNLDFYSEISSELLEQSIRLAATLASHYIEEGVQVAFATNGKDDFSPELINISEGTSNAHLCTIFESLARIRLGLQTSHVKDYINEIIDRERLFIFISPYHEKDILNAFMDLKERGVDAFMIVPFFRNIEISIPETSDFFAWDATTISEIQEEAV
ncbi:MAG: DUF58 domain-containing protein [Defluviitaleaceae bacterium]|nr:DUF58 domain-containing protein [Defluviitaleaceae bacterium]